MSLNVERDKTELFSVVGAPYVAEQHIENQGNLAVETDEKEELLQEASIANHWAVFYLVIAGAWLFGSGTAGRAFDYVVALVK